MADYKHQEQDLRAGLQHLANHKQEASATPAVLVHQHQVALVVVQDLERPRVDPSIQHPAGEPLPLQTQQ